MTEAPRRAHEAAWPDMFRSLQEAYAQLTRTEQELERQKSEIEEARDLFVQVIESMSEALFLLDLSGTVVRANRAAGRLLGARPEALAGEPFAEVCGNPDVPATPWEIEEWEREGKEPTDFDAEVVTRSGDRVPALLSCSMVRADGGAVRGVLVMIRDVTDRRAAQDRIRESLQQKEVLLREVHHRVKNNLQLVSSLLRLQSRRLDDPAESSVLREAWYRIGALARLHEHLYRDEDVSVVDFGGYLGTLTHELAGAFGGNSVRVEVEAEEIDVGLDTAIPCGLIVNELVTNSLEHAYPGGRSGTVTVRVKGTPEGGMIIDVADDGVGLPRDADAPESETLGLGLVRTLARQVRGEVTVEGDPGTRVRVAVPADAVQLTPP